MLGTRYRVGLKRRWKSTSGWVLGIWGVQWSIFNPIINYFPNMKTEIGPWTYLGIFVASALVVVLWRLKEPVSVLFQFKTTNTKVEVVFGDIFEIDGHIAISVNEYFDGQLGDLVSPRSVHGQFIQRFFDGDARRFEEAVDAVLPKDNFKYKIRPPLPRTKVYPIGTTAVIPAGERKAFLFALTETDPKTSKAHADVPMMWVALQGMWKSVRLYSNGNKVGISLIGGGQSGVGLEPSHLLRLIVLSLLAATRKKEVTKTVTVVLRNEDFERVDLRSVVEDWR